MSIIITPIKGGFVNIKNIFFGGINCGLKNDNKEDLGFIYCEKSFNIKAIFTSNKFKASPLLHFLKYPKNFKSNFILLNSKNANAMNGVEGARDIENIFKHLGKKINLLNPIMSSTGVIGQRLDIDKIKNGLDIFSYKERNFNPLVKSIMTTDAFEKTSSYKIETQETSFNVCAIAKGAGMINPSMATMLCFIITDADVPNEDMQELLDLHNQSTFDSISVDGDTSTNDTVMLFTTNEKKKYNKEAFSMALHRVMLDLSIEIMKDAEGASKIVAFDIKGAVDNEQAKRIAKKLSNSLLVKTAIFGKDPNWGRIASTIGASGCDCDESLLSISYDDVIVLRDGVNVFTKEVEQKAFKVLSKDSYKIQCNLNLGEGKYRALGCDLGHKYVEINSSYRS